MALVRSSRREHAPEARAIVGRREQVATIANKALLELLALFRHVRVVAVIFERIVEQQAHVLHHPLYDVAAALRALASALDVFEDFVQAYRIVDDVIVVGNLGNVDRISAPTSGLLSIAGKCEFSCK